LRITNPSNLNLVIKKKGRKKKKRENNEGKNQKVSGDVRRRPVSRP